MDPAELNRLVDGARCRITDDDFDQAEMSAEDEQILIERMVDRGYTIGLDKDYRNVWWPPERSELKHGIATVTGKVKA